MSIHNTLVIPVERSNIRFCYERMFFYIYFKYMNLMLVLSHLNNTKFILIENILVTCQVPPSV